MKEIVTYAAGLILINMMYIKVGVTDTDQCLFTIVILFMLVLYQLIEIKNKLK